MTRQQIDQDHETARAAIENCLKLQLSPEGSFERKRDALVTALQAVDRLHAAALQAVEPESLIGKRVRFADGSAGKIESDTFLACEVSLRENGVYLTEAVRLSTLELLENTDDKS